MVYRLITARELQREMVEWPSFQNGFAVLDCLRGQGSNGIYVPVGWQIYVRHGKASGQTEE